MNTLFPVLRKVLAAQTRENDERRRREHEDTQSLLEVGINCSGSSGALKWGGGGCPLRDPGSEERKGGSLRSRANVISIDGMK